MGTKYSKSSQPRLGQFMKATNAIIPTDHNPQLDNESKSVKKKKKP